MNASEIKVGMEVIGGEREDSDIGIVHDVERDRAFVGWQSGVSTWTPIEDLKPAVD